MPAVAVVLQRNLPSSAAADVYDGDEEKGGRRSAVSGSGLWRRGGPEQMMSSNSRATRFEIPLTVHVPQLLPITCNLNPMRKHT